MWDAENNWLCQVLKDLFVFYVYECWAACIYADHVHEWSLWKSEKGSNVFPKLELEMFLSFHVNSENQTLSSERAHAFNILMVINYGII